MLAEACNPKQGARSNDMCVTKGKRRSGDVRGMNEVLVSMENIEKSFPGVYAVKNVSLQLRAGEVHALLGENGAGKSTLMKMLTGAYRKDAGRIIYKGQEVDINSPKEAQDLGISIIYQEFNLFPHLTVAQNIYMGREPRSKVRGVLNEQELNKQAGAVLTSLNLKIKPTDRVDELSVAKQQMVVVAKALSMKSEVLIMDEPTSALTENETDELFKVIHKLKNNKVGIIYISHKLEELKQIADRVSVMRDGAYVGTLNYKDTNLDELISMMVGRTITEKYPKRANVKITGRALEVKNISRGDVLKNISFYVKKGEILGVFGLMGAGRTELARAIFGADGIDSGEILIDGKLVKFNSPNEAIKRGVGYLSEDRKKDGLALELDVENNITLASVVDISNRIGVINRDKSIQESTKQVKRLNIRTPSLRQKVRFLSGGNQQKVILGKWLCKNSKVIIFDEPTRGIDVGAKLEVHTIMNELVSKGVAVIMISSELPEVLGMADRIMVMHEGKKAKELNMEKATQEKVIYYATGGE